MLEFAVGEAQSEPGKSHRLRVCMVCVRFPNPRGIFSFF